MLGQVNLQHSGDLLVLGGIFVVCVSFRRCITFVFWD